MKRAHRVSYAAFNGDVSTGLEVMHTCDNRRCVNPSHLKVGTHAENMVDMKARGVRRGKNHPLFGVPRNPALYAAMCKPVVVGGKEYPGRRMAERELGLSHGAVLRRIKAGKAFYLNEE